MQKGLGALFLLAALLAPLFPSLAEAQTPGALGLEAGEQFLIREEDASQDIEFPGAAGGREHTLAPAPHYTAEKTGDVSKVRLYLARNADLGLSGRSWDIQVFDETSQNYACTLISGTEGGANFTEIPIGDASHAALIEFSDPRGNCFFVAGDTYSFRLGYRVPGDPTWTNGILYTKGSDTTSAFFLQVIGPIVPPPPLPEIRPGERLLIDEHTTSSSIVFDGAAGGREHTLAPAPLYTAIGSGAVSRVRLHIARNRVHETDQSLNSTLALDLLDSATNARICTLLSAWKNPSGPQQDNYRLLPVGGALDMALVEFTAPQSDCVIETGRSYTASLSYRVDGDPRFTNGILYMKGADTASAFFLQVLADDGAPLCTENCFSNVLFLPGIQGSAMKEGENLRWPSTLLSQDVARLALNEDGSSANDITVAGVLGTFAPGVD
ncbi:MAG: hypothetical protein WBK28_04205, partial [Minisyncoccia bacterium]